MSFKRRESLRCKKHEWHSLGVPQFIYNDSHRDIGFKQLFGCRLCCFLEERTFYYSSNEYSTVHGKNDKGGDLTK